MEPVIQIKLDTLIITCEVYCFRKYPMAKVFADEAAHGSSP